MTKATKADNVRYFASVSCLYIRNDVQFDDFERLVRHGKYDVLREPATDAKASRTRLRLNHDGGVLGGAPGSVIACR